MHNRQRRGAEKANHFWPTTKRLLTYLRPWRLAMVIAIGMAIASVITSIIAPKILGEATTTIYQGIMKGYTEIKMGQHLTTFPIDFAKIGRIALIVLVLYLLSGFFSFGQQIIMTRVSQRAVFNLRRDFKAKLARVPVKYYDATSNGEIMSRMVNDMDNIATALQQGIIQIITSLLTIIGALTLMILISWRLTLVALVTIPLSAIVVGFVAPTAQKLFERQQAALGKINAQVEEVYAGQTIIRAFNHEQDEAAKFAEHNENYYRAAWRAQFFSVLIFPLMNFINNVGYLLVVVVGTIQVIHGQITLGNVQAFIQYVNQFTRPLTQIANLSSTIQQTIASAERIFAVLDEAEMDESKTTTPVKNQPQPMIEFEHVDFAYDPKTPLIQDFNLRAKRNEMVAIVGPTGAGKTTIINLLERFYDVNNGKIFLDGRDTRSMSRHELRQHLAMVLQETWLFTGTIFENIKYGREDATDEEVYQAARMARADNFIRELPNGYDTVLDETASNISQGQRQLLTIARAFLADPEVLILDEATSSVDTRTEVQIQAAMRKLQESRTSFVVAHRLSTIQKAEQIIVLNHGRVVETGDHDSLMVQNGFYADLYNSQFSGQMTEKA
ncbi:ABC transporter ATP-binding protein [Lactobacillus sp. 3B(2020)]|uniref:ABC transporter ATP-binding protein n=1 Tax=Lactobacillus sp. 3B(2020) TaxID=2695882 RepID=UPI0015DE8202|nr:ABC transporter ATP-binding protein [Lactobacillus sp. 3B(2020)]QLL69650.1 ATP-binding cassette domain-containing protein [Lactobacillus sp. 3B(2020)]